MVTIDSNKEDINLLIKVSGDVDASSSIFLDNALEEAVGNQEQQGLFHRAGHQARVMTRA